jgi:predicted alpha/beta hydrolase
MTYTFDYRYTGLSFPPPYDAQSFTEEERNAAMRTCPEDVTLTKVWAKKDFAAVVRHASDENPGIPLTIVSNSLGSRKTKRLSLLI